MENYTRIIRKYSNINFHFTKGKIDIFLTKQFHPFYEIYLLVGGKAEFINDHIRRDIKPNDLVIIPPGEYHRFMVEDEYVPAYERCVLDIHPKFFPDTVLEEALDGKELLTLPATHRIVENIMYLKDSMTQNTEQDFEYILSAIATDIVFLIKQFTGACPSNTTNFSHPISSKIMDYINQNYKRNITLSDIAEHFFLSVSSVSHIFKDDFGISIKRYLTEKRMNEIHTCLQNGQKSQELCEEFGFSNYSTFYRSYCKHFGTPPSQAQKKQQT